jgi:hypothetical protein
MLRSAGITDLRYGNVLDDDWRDRDRFARMGDQRGPAPLPTDVACYAVAARLGRGSFDARALVLGDGLVPVDSALGRHREPERALDFPESRCFVGHDMSHFDLLDRAEVYARLRAWLG